MSTFKHSIEALGSESCTVKNLNFTNDLDVNESLYYLRIGCTISIWVKISPMSPMCGMVMAGVSYLIAPERLI